MIVGGSISVPGDKSLTHRALLLAGLASGPSTIRGGLTSLDAQASARVLRQLGAGISSLRLGASVTVHGRRRFTAPTSALHCGNSGTTARLLLGVLASHPFTARLTGDASLRRRPMRRVTEPLAIMGASFHAGGNDGLPVTVQGGPLRGLRWEMPVSSAQIKSALLLAGLTSGVPVSVREPNGRSRDHTERLLLGMGFRVDDEPNTGWIHFHPGGELTPFDVTVPGDPSSAAFLVGAALLAEGGELRITGVGLNPTRTGFLRVLERMGATVETVRGEDRLGEPVGDLVVAPTTLRATEVSAGEIPALIDEIPMLAVLASRAEGTTTFHEVGELRVKESDRLSLLAENLSAIGVEARADRNTLWVTGTDRPPVGRVKTEGDHRIAMAFSVLGTLPGARVVVDDPDCAAVSFPGFATTLSAIEAS